MKKHLAATVLAALGATPALAADLSAPSNQAPSYTKAPPMAAPANWSGWYVGGNIGYGWANNAAEIDFVDGGNILNHSFNAGSHSALGGGQLGYNWQWGAVVLGLETDIQGAGLSGAVSVAPLAGATLAAGGDPTFAATTQKLSWFGTTRARLGYSVMPGLLLYGTGGAAYGGIKITTDGIVSPINQAHLLGSLDETKIGWTVGAGAEWMFMRNWSAKLEYLYFDLGNATAFGPQGTATTRGSNDTWTFKENIVRAGLNYHF